MRAIDFVIAALGPAARVWFRRRLRPTATTTSDRHAGAVRHTARQAIVYAKMLSTHRASEIKNQGSKALEILWAKFLGKTQEPLHKSFLWNKSGAKDHNRLRDSRN